MVCTHPLVLHEQTGCIAATKVVRTVVILNGSDASGPLANGRALRMYIDRPKGGFEWTPLNPSTYGPEDHHQLDIWET